jgi:hypothetical protein
VARNGINLPIPREVLVALPWSELLERMTAVAVLRLPGRPVDDARQLALEAARVFIDPESSVIWDHEAEPDPRRCLGSILNGLLRNYFRIKRTNAEVPSDSRTIETVGGAGAGTPEQILIERDTAAAVLGKVYDRSATDPLVRQLVELAKSGIIDVDEQRAALSISTAALYEARRRFRERLEQAVRELEA